MNLGRGIEYIFNLHEKTDPNDRRSTINMNFSLHHSIGFKSSKAVTRTRVLGSECESWREAIFGVQLDQE